MNEKTVNHKRGGRLIMVAVMTLLMMNVATALQVKTFNEDLFEIDAFQQGDIVVILAEAELTPSVTITGTEIVDKEMEELEEGKYRDLIQYKKKEHTT